MVSVPPPGYGASGNRPTVLVVDDDRDIRNLLREVLQHAGFEVETAATGNDAWRALEASTPTLLLLDLFLPEVDGFELLRRVRAEPRLEGLPVVILTASDEEQHVSRAFEIGADDLLRKPVKTEELLARLNSQIRWRASVEELAGKERDAKVMLELTRALASSLDVREILGIVVRRIADVARVDRVSIVLAPEEEGVGFVVATSDDAEVADLRLDLAKYPEIQEVLRTHEPLTINDAQTHPVLDGVRASMPEHALGAISLVPIVWEERAMGVLFLRAQPKRGSLSERELRFCATVANTTAVALRNARIIQSLRAETQEVSEARRQAESRLRVLERYKDLFASSADGIAVVDAAGRLLFANPRAFEIMGVDENDMISRKLRDFLHEDDKAMARAIWEGFARGVFPRGVDLKALRRDGTTIVLNASFSLLQDGGGAILFSFRDVTEQKRIEGELLRTKEFLESLIDASVDAIVAADMKGNIILFNKGAERIYNRKREDTIGKLHVTALYADQVAKEIMRMIRSPEHGGVGRIEELRAETVDAQGQRIPISLSAATIYDNGVPVATFGVFTDLRERLRSEERLAQAQEKLAEGERQALIAELAGAAAHELNQPLTSMMAYAELLRRKLASGGTELRAVEMIFKETERMADIVRKIGKITKYETKSYVGQQKILDLEKSASDDAARMATDTNIAKEKH